MAGRLILSRGGGNDGTPYRRAVSHPIIASPISSSAIASGDSAGMVCPTVVVAEAVLFAGAGSGVDEAIVAVSDTCVPGAMLCGTLKVNWNVALAPALNVAIEQTIGPVPLQLNAGPVVWFAETKVIPVGTVSVSVTLA